MSARSDGGTCFLDHRGYAPLFHVPGPYDSHADSASEGLHECARPRPSPNLDRTFWIDEAVDNRSRQQGRVRRVALAGKPSCVAVGIDVNQAHRFMSIPRKSIQDRPRLSVLTTHCERNYFRIFEHRQRLRDFREIAVEAEAILLKRDVAPIDGATYFKRNESGDIVE